MNKFSYYITTHFIPSNKDYHSYHDSHSVYQTYHNILICILRRERIKNDLANHVPLDWTSSSVRNHKFEAYTGTVVTLWANQLLFFQLLFASNSIVSAILLYVIWLIVKKKKITCVTNLGCKAVLAQLSIHLDTYNFVLGLLYPCIKMVIHYSSSYFQLIIEDFISKKN